MQFFVKNGCLQLPPASPHPAAADSRHQAPTTRRREEAPCLAIDSSEQRSLSVLTCFLRSRKPYAGVKALKVAQIPGHLARLGLIACRSGLRRQVNSGIASLTRLRRGFPRCFGSIKLCCLLPGSSTSSPWLAGGCLFCAPWTGSPERQRQREFPRSQWDLVLARSLPSLARCRPLCGYQHDAFPSPCPRLRAPVLVLTIRA
nr:PREDICTED: uncharacterized protein LOC104140493 [Struthio camelus australis]